MKESAPSQTRIGFYLASLTPEIVVYPCNEPSFVMALYLFRQVEEVRRPDRSLHVGGELRVRRAGRLEGHGAVALGQFQQLQQAVHRLRLERLQLKPGKTQ